MCIRDSYERIVASAPVSHAFHQTVKAPSAPLHCAVSLSAYGVYWGENSVRRVEEGHCGYFHGEKFNALLACVVAFEDRSRKLCCSSILLLKKSICKTEDLAVDLLGVNQSNEEIDEK
eukprot:TRINITY_DN11783_c0_g1_i4.p1 TRINITY_DN11783_c0_g1~~TRINITY_DN11783_c0_g1_i4.p1  ORF type:complete len:118 (+),score=5.61 TRINITY_DN11783_c0_g1_i4:71-424(+)